MSYATRAVRAGQQVFREGDWGKEAYLVKGGRITLSRERDGVAVVLDTLEPGAVFGEMAVIAHTPRSATATADEDSELVVIDRKGLTKALDEAHPLVRKLMEHFQERLQAANERIEARTTAEDVRRTAQVLDLMQQGRAAEEDESTWDIRRIGMKAFMRRAKAATGLAADDLRRALERLEAEDLIRIKAEKVGEHRFEHLIRVFEPDRFLRKVEQAVADWPRTADPPAERESLDLYEFASRLELEPEEVLRRLLARELPPELARFPAELHDLGG